MMGEIKSYYTLILIALFSLLKTENSDIYLYYSLNQGANLLSFPLIIDNSNIDEFFADSNPNLISNDGIQDNIISIISEGEIGININQDWAGSLDQISTQKGYWLMLDEPMNFLYVSDNLDENLFFLHPGSNLISFPYNNEISLNDALPIYTQDILDAIIGENESLLIYENNYYGSLSTFKPGNGYWFIANDYGIFQYDNVPQSSLENHSSHSPNNRNSVFNQSMLQSIYFTKSIYLSGNENIDELFLNIYCDDILVGQKNWISEFTDLIAMGNDGYEWTLGYCEIGEPISIRNDSEEQFFIIEGSNEWLPNNYSLITLSDSDFGDLNFSQFINIADIIIMVEHIIGTNLFNNIHQSLLADINQDEMVNIADIMINIEIILSN